METTKTLTVRSEIIDQSIENALPENCTMSILFKKDGLVFSVLRTDTQKFIVLGDYHLAAPAENYAELFQFKTRLEGTFASYQIGFQGPDFIILPAPLFQADQIQKYAKFQFSLSENYIVKYDEIAQHQLVVVYSVPQVALRESQTYFNNAEVKHAVSLEIEFYLSNYKNKPGQHAFIHVFGNQISVLILANGTLQLANQFTWKTNEDLLYFVLNCFEQLGLNPEEVPLKIAGELDKTNPCWELLRTYFKIVEGEKKPENFQYSHQFNLLNQHKYNRVFQAATCV